MKMRSCLISLFVLSLGVFGTEVRGQEETPAPAKSRSGNGEMIYLRDFGTDEVGFLSVPMQEPKLGILVVPDGRGLDGRIKKLCEALAARGYLALAVDIYNGRVAEDESSARTNRKSVEPEAVRKGLETGLNFYAKSPRFQMQRTALLALGDADEFAIALCRETKNRSLMAVSLAGGTVEVDERELRQRLQRLEPLNPADPGALAAQLDAFWSSPETRKNFFERLIE